MTCHSDPITQRGGLVGRGAVLYDVRDPRARSCCARPEDRCLVHVRGVYKETTTGEVYYKISDGTWTTQEWIHGDDLLALFEPAGWSVIGIKPTYLLTRGHGVDDHHDVMTDGGQDPGDRAQEDVVGVHAREKDGRMSFRVPLLGRVVVRNETYPDPENHSYLVEFDGLNPQRCSCDDYQYRKKNTPQACKHIRAVCKRPAVVAAAAGLYGTPDDHDHDTGPEGGEDGSIEGARATPDDDHDDGHQVGFVTDGGPTSQQRAELAVDRIIDRGGPHYMRGGR